MQASLQLIFMHAPHSGSFAAGVGGQTGGNSIRYNSFVMKILDDFCRTASFSSSS